MVMKDRLFDVASKTWVDILVRGTGADDFIVLEIVTPSGEDVTYVPQEHAGGLFQALRERNLAKITSYTERHDDANLYTECEPGAPISFGVFNGRPDGVSTPE